MISTFSSLNLAQSEVDYFWCSWYTIFVKETMFKRTITFALVGVFLWANAVGASMSSTNYEIRWDTISTGGSDTSSSTSYTLRDLVGGSGDGNSNSTNYQLRAGYRSGVIDEIVSFDLFIQNFGGGGTTATGLSGTTVTVSSTSGFSANDYVAIVQDIGASQVVAIGKISSVGAGSLILDRLQTAGTTPTIDGSNDKVFIMNSGSVSFGEISEADFKSRIAGFEITVDNDNGYSIQVLDDGNLRSGEYDINDVADGSVTAHVEEYGARSSDTSVAGTTFDTQDTAITTSTQAMVTQSSFSYADRSFIVLKVARSGDTQPGNYAQTITFIVSGNF